jgi:glycosyltransferase involved in cell wall biosynthesis
MHLGVNAIRLCRNFTGVGRYIECVLAEWAKMDLPFERITLFTHTPLEQAKLAFPLDRYQLRVIGQQLPDPVWEATALRKAAREVDVFFSPSYTLPIGISGKCVVTNLGPPENTPFSYQWFRAHAYEALYLASAHRANRVLACSHSVKQRLIDVYRVRADKISVTYLAASDLFRPIEDPEKRRAVRARYQIPPGPIILFVGKMARRHYIPNLIEAFSQLKQDGAVPHRLVLVGPDYLKIDIMGIARRFGVEAHVTHVNYATHADLPALYSDAEFFVFPASEAEGFGIPVVEAMACGTPVVTTALGSVREVATGAAVTGSAPSTAELFAGMRRMASDADLRRELVPKGIERSAQFTWPITARKTMEVLAEVGRS